MHLRSKLKCIVRKLRRIEGALRKLTWERSSGRRDMEIGWEKGRRLHIWKYPIERRTHRFAHANRQLPLQLTSPYEFFAWTPTKGGQSMQTESQGISYLLILGWLGGSGTVYPSHFNIYLRRRSHPNTII